MNIAEKNGKKSQTLPKKTATFINKQIHDSYMASSEEISEVLFRNNPWWNHEEKWTALERPEYESRLQKLNGKNDIVLITGLRRVGKTMLMKRHIKWLLSKEEPKKVLFVPLDAYGLLDTSIHDIVREYRKIHALSTKEKVFLFFDEVASKADFATELKDFHDSENAKIFASASSASELRKEAASGLTGRTRTVEVMPLGFSEYMSFRGFSKTSETQILERHFEDYMRDGGMPEYVLSRDPGDIQKVIDDILLKDIGSKKGFPDSSQIKQTFRLLCERAGKKTTVSRLANILGTSRDTVSRLLSAFEESFLFYAIPRWGTLNEQVKAPKKYYIGDVGIRNITTGFRDKGAVFENLVFLTLKDKSPKYYLEGEHEIDFAFEDTLIETKLGREMQPGQKEIYEKAKFKNKIIVDGFSYFLSG